MSVYFKLCADVPRKNPARVVKIGVLPQIPFNYGDYIVISLTI